MSDFNIDPYHAIRNHPESQREATPQICCTCRFYSQEFEEKGYCRLNPPSTIFTPNHRCQTTLVPLDDFTTCWPITHKFDWCGQWERWDK